MDVENRRADPYDFLGFARLITSSAFQAVVYLKLWAGKRNSRRSARDANKTSESICVLSKEAFNKGEHCVVARIP
jgi:hypothetical protein